VPGLDPARRCGGDAGTSADQPVGVEIRQDHPRPLPGAEQARAAIAAADIGDHVLRPDRKARVELTEIGAKPAMQADRVQPDMCQLVVFRRWRSNVHRGQGLAHRAITVSRREGRACGD
jgi:hypothetical protein